MNTHFCRHRVAPLALLLTAIPLLLSCAVGADRSATDALRVTNLRCECLTNPLGLNETSPRLSWVLDSSRRGEKQSAYQVLVASSPDLLAQNRPDLWDSGKVDSDESAHVVYAGRELTSRATCFWTVRIWSGLTGTPTDWSRPAFFTVGLLASADWHAQWICTPDAAAAPRSTSPIKILHATYASKKPKASVDVTDKIASLVRGSTLHLTASPDTLGKDPAPNASKNLDVEYEQDGITATSRAADGHELSIPEALPRIYYLRKSFATNSGSPIVHATLYATARGLYEISINGQRVGDHILAPDWTDYAKRIRYQAYDVAPLLSPGKNAIGALLANGWYAGHLGNGGFQQYGKIPSLLAQLEITHADGTTEIISTDATWKTHESPILSSDFMYGEAYDARAEISGWNATDLDDSSWQNAATRNGPPVALDSQIAPPVRETQLLHPIALTEPAPQHYVFDLGQNMVGVVRLNVSAPAGTKITIRHAEVLNPDGTLYTTNLRRAMSTDLYTCKGTGAESWQPRFTFHGFRYVELTGLPQPPTKDAVTGVVLGTDCPRTGTFTCSDPRINQLVSNIEWGQRGNYLSVPTDCPQRDERLGWMGDAEVFVRTATDNADIASFFSKWLVDVDDAQRPDGAFTDVSPWRGANSGTPAWADAGVICPWTIYLAYGDTRILEQHLPAMTRWVEWCHTHSTNLIRDKDRGADYGDWLAIGAVTPKDLIGTAYFAYSTHLLAKSYAAVGNTEQAAKYNQLFNDIKAAFNKKYVSPDGRITGDTQSCYDMALKFELLPDNLRPLAAQHLQDDIHAKHDHLSTGFVGVSYLLPTLADAGKIDTAFALLLQDTFPSWLFSVKQGATTIWERWDGWTPDKGFQDPGMNSFNHYSLGSCGEWLYDSVAGIDWDPQHPGYKHILLHPTPGPGITFAHASLHSPYGTISSAWTLKKGTFTLHLTIPPNTTATLSLPAKPNTLITESGKPISPTTPSESNIQKLTLDSGTYTFTSTP